LNSVAKATARKGVIRKMANQNQTSPLGLNQDDDNSKDLGSTSSTSSAPSAVGSSSKATTSPSSPSQSSGGTVSQFNRSGSQSSSGSTGAATATARSFYDQAKETAGQAYEAVTDKAATKLDEQKSTLSGGLSTVADSVRQVSQNLNSSTTESGLAETAARYTDTAARKIENVATYFENKNVREMARDLEGFARRNPAVFLGAAFGLGLLAARFLKSTSPRYDTAAAGREFDTPRKPAGQLSATTSPNPQGSITNS
jgi:hypothetical protein